MNVTVMSRTDAIKYCYHKHEDKSVIISISDPFTVYNSSPFCSDYNNVFGIFHVAFFDSDTGIGIMTEADAKRIANYIRRICRGKNTKDAKIIVHCDAGRSRSAVVAAAIMKWLNGDDSPIFDNPKYTPNMHCYRTMLNALMEE